MTATDNRAAAFFGNLRAHSTAKAHRQYLNDICTEAGISRNQLWRSLTNSGHQRDLAPEAALQIELITDGGCRAEWLCKQLTLIRDLIERTAEVRRQRMRRVSKAAQVLAEAGERQGQ